MFTGIIEEVGAVARRSGCDLAILASKVIEDVHEGDSIAVNGVCLTVAAFDGKGFVAQMSPETMERTTLGGLRAGDAVNLERAMMAGGRFGGHFVLGHVDGVGRVKAVLPQGRFTLWRFQGPVEVTRYLAPKGSIAVDGVSLTIIEPAGDTFGVAVIPTTRDKTVLFNRRPGDPVNLEADIIAKQTWHFVRGQRETGLTAESLARNGFG